MQQGKISHYGGEQGGKKNAGPALLKAEPDPVSFPQQDRPMHQARYRGAMAWSRIGENKKERELHS